MKRKHCAGYHQADLFTLSARETRKDVSLRFIVIPNFGKATNQPTNHPTEPTQARGEEPRRERNFP
jgi:hypothetical protein